MEDERRNGNGRRAIDDLVGRVGNVETRQGRVFDLLIGPEEEEVDGSMKRNTEEGMDYKVGVLYEQSQKGGLRVRLTGRDRVLLVAAFLSAGGAVTAALIS